MTPSIELILIASAFVIVGAIMIKSSNKHSQQDQAVIHAYQKITGEQLTEGYMVEQFIQIGLDSPQDPALDSILRDHRYKTMVFFTDKGILIIKRYKDQLKSYQLIPYSKITKYYYKINESQTNRQIDVIGTINILFDKGTLYIPDIDIDNINKPLIFKQLDNHTTNQQRVAPTHNIGLTLSWSPRSSFRYKVKHHTQTTNDIKWHHIITKALIKDSINEHRRVKKYF